MAINLPPALLAGTARAAALGGQLAPIAAIGGLTYGAYKFFVPKKTIYDKMAEAGEKFGKIAAPVTIAIGVIKGLDEAYSLYKKVKGGVAAEDLEQWFEEETARRQAAKKKEEEEKETRQKEFDVRVEKMREEEAAKYAAKLAEVGLSPNGEKVQPLRASGAKINRNAKKVSGTKKTAYVSP